MGCSNWLERFRRKTPNFTVRRKRFNLLKGAKKATLNLQFVRDNTNTAEEILNSDSRVDMNTEDTSIDSSAGHFVLMFHEKCPDVEKMFETD